MAANLANTAVQLLILMSSSGFQAQAPQLGAELSPSFPDSAAGGQAFIEWLRPRFPKGRWNPPPSDLCVVGIEPFGEATPQVPLLVHGSKPPFRVLEPYQARFFYITEEQAKAGVKRRTLAQAQALCGFGGAGKARTPKPAAAASRAS